MTPKQRKFAEYYAKEPEVLSAALKAGYSEHYARTKGKVLLGHPEIVAEIQRLRSRINERAEKSATDVVNEFAKIAFTDRVGFLKPDPDLPGQFVNKAPNELTAEQRAIVEKVITRPVEVVVVNPDTRQNETVIRQEYDYVFSDKSNALQQMGRHFGIFDDKLRLTTTQNNPFKNASPEKLEQLRRAWVETMNAGNLIEGKVIEK